MHNISSDFFLHTPLLIASDYDGTLAPFVPSPPKAFPDPQAWKAFTQLADLPGVHIALLTGRARKDVLNISQFSQGLVVGGHGAELPDGSLVLSEAEKEIYHQLHEKLRIIAASIKGAFIEKKPFSQVLHFRKATEEVDDAIIDEAHTLAKNYPNITMTIGKKVVEFSLRKYTKGDGIDWLMNTIHPAAVIFVGDDTTDEDAFVRLNEQTAIPSYTLKVGEGLTNAHDRVADISQVATFFTEIYSIRTTHAPTP